MWHNAYIGKPFDDKGRGPDAYDCWGLVQAVFRDQLDIDLPGYEWLYDNTNQRETLGKAICDERQQQCWQEVWNPQPFDVVLLTFVGVPMHVGIVTRPGYMLHCAHGVGTVLERYDSLRWKHKVQGFFRYEQQS